MINFKEVFVAWKTLAKPTEFQAKVAKDRLDVCVKCPYKKEVFEKKEWSAICGKCGCPLKAKIFSQEVNPCPMGYWIKPDDLNGIKSKPKNKNSIL